MNEALRPDLEVSESQGKLGGLTMPVASFPDFVKSSKEGLLIILLKICILMWLSHGATFCAFVEGELVGLMCLGLLRILKGVRGLVIMTVGLVI